MEWDARTRWTPHARKLYCMGKATLIDLRWPVPSYMRVGHVFESRFSAGIVSPISIIFGILNKEWSNFKNMLFIFS